MALNTSVEFASSDQTKRRFGRDLPFMLVDLMRVGDPLLVLLAGVVALHIPSMPFHSDDWPRYTRDATFGALLVPLLFDRRRIYDQDTLHRPWHAARSIVAALGLLLGVLAVIGFGTRAIEGLSRIWVVYWLGGAAILLLLQRALLAGYVSHLERTGMLREVVAIVGAGPLADRLMERIVASGANVDIAGVYDDRAGGRVPEGSTLPRGTLGDLLELGKGRRIDRILITLPWSAEARLLQLLRRLKALAVDVELCPEAVGFRLPTRNFSTIGDLPLLLVANRPLMRWAYIVKMLEDRVLGGIMLAMLSPLLLIVAIAIKLDSPGPVLFKQKRHGFNNTVIDVYKFRTMRHDLTDHDGARQTQRADPRVTRIGAFLRPTSLDELPQLINVMRGEMSLVGPRPHPVGMRTQDQLCHEIIEDYAHRHRVRPGITGWAQVNGYRGATENEEQLRRRVEHDIQYIENWSLIFDLKILCMTVFKVLSHENAF